MKRYRLWIAIGLISIILMACNLASLLSPATAEDVEKRSQVETKPTAEVKEPPQVENTQIPTPDSLDSAKACLAGTWEIVDLSSYVIAAIPPELAAQYKLKYKETSGYAELSLTPDGRITLAFHGLIFLFDANVSVFTVPLTVGIDGDINGGYSVDESTLSTSGMNTNDLTSVAQALGQDVVDPAMIKSVIPLVQTPFNRAVYTCAGDTLQLEFPAYPENIPPLVFQRVN